MSPREVEKRRDVCKRLGCRLRLHAVVPSGLSSDPRGEDHSWPRRRLVFASGATVCREEESFGRVASCPYPSGNPDVAICPAFGVRLPSFGAHILPDGARFLRFGLHLSTFGVHFPTFGVHLLPFGLHLPTFGLHLSAFGVHLPAFGLHPSRFGLYRPSRASNRSRGRSNWGSRGPDLRRMESNGAHSAPYGDGQTDRGTNTARGDEGSGP
ncbi:MAG: hypothetical protein QOF89_5781 [Acidobacteriota bacterium]|jgi:hypothetical protein|nr:hypothetical protein [Acidobacteriota bacterium]